MMIKSVTADVKGITGGKQTPFQYSSLDLEYSLNADGKRPAVAAAGAAKPLTGKGSASPSLDFSGTYNPAGKDPNAIELRLTNSLLNGDHMKSDKIESLQNMAVSLLPQTRLGLYNKYKKSGAFWASLGNTIIGAGSWIQGDYVGGAVASGLWCGGFALIGITSGTDSTGIGSSIGALLWLAGLVTGWVVPYVFESRYNTNLRISLLTY
jgi:Borrelia membrane protein P13.